MEQRFQKITSSSIPFPVLPKESQQKARKQRILLYIHLDTLMVMFFPPLFIFFIVFYQDRNHTIHSLMDDDDDDDDSCLQSQNLR